MFVRYSHINSLITNHFCNNFKFDLSGNYHFRQTVVRCMYTVMEAKIIVIFDLLRAGYNMSEIAKQLNVRWMTIHSHRETEKRWRSQVSTSPSRLLGKHLKRIQRTKWRACEKKKKISVTTVSRAVKNKGGKCFRCAKRSLLTVRMHEKRQKCCRHFRNDLKSQGNCIVIFANEKNFTLVEHLRCQNRPDVVSEVRNVSSNKH